MKTKLPLGISVAALAILGATTGLVHHVKSSNAAGQSERKVLFYQDSMHPWIKSDRPGKCTVCEMDLTPIYEGQAGFGSSSNLVVISPSQVTVLSVQTDQVQRRSLIRRLRVAGILEANEAAKTVVSAPARGRIDALAVDYAGIEVERGQKLITMFSPELVQLRKTLLAVRQGAQRGATNSVPPAQADPGIYTGDILAPQSGVVMERNVYNGQYVAEGDRLLTIVDTSVLWFRFDVYQPDLPWIELGQTIEVEVPGIPGKTFPAVIAFIEPAFNETTRTVKVRADIANPALKIGGCQRRGLKPGMYAQGIVRAELPGVLAVPRTAILSPGGAAYAFVDKGGGAYERRRLTLGQETDGFWEVLKGVDEGDRVVTSGNVLIDAQAQFNGPSNPEDNEPEHMTILGVASTHGSERETAGPPETASRADEAMAVRDPPLLAPTASSAAPDDLDNAPAAPLPVTHHAAARRTERMAAIMSPGGELQLTRRAAIERELALKTTDATQASTSGTMHQQEALRAFLAEAGSVSKALAADDLESFKEHVSKLPAVLRPLTNAFPATNPLGPHLQRAAATQWHTAKDLADARNQFLPFSTAVVNLVKQLKKQDQTFADLKIYHCPMAPEPGLWIQSKGPLANPFYGSKMLRCGEEVTR